MAQNLRLAAARVLRGMTQRDLAERIAQRENDVSRYETGRAVPEADTKRRIAEALGEPTDELFQS